MFTPLSRSDIRKVVDLQFNIIKTRLAENGVKLEADEKVLEYISEIGFDPQFGARPLKRVLQRNILNELSKQILSGKISQNSIVGITLNNDRQIEFMNLDEVEI
jgi:ATP-dependent Clp protease ATP-binding subunit ClpB